MSVKENKVVVKDNMIYATNFKSRFCVAVIDFFVPKDKVKYSTLKMLASLMNNYPKYFSSSRTKLRTQMLMYNSSTSFDVYNRNDSYVFSMKITCPSDDYIKSAYRVEKRAIKTGINTFNKGPKTDPLSLTLVKGRMIKSIKNKKNNPIYKALEGLTNTFIPKSLFLESDYSEEEVKQINESMILSAFNEVKKSNRNISSVGFDHSISLLLKHFKGNSQHFIDIPFNNPESDVKSSSIKTNLLSTAMAFAYSFNSHEYSLKNYYVREIFASMMNGMNGPLFKVLREEQGLSYSFSFRIHYFEKMIFIYFNTSPFKVNTALKSMDEVILNHQKYLSEEIFQMAKKELLLSVNSKMDAFEFDFLIHNNFYHNLSYDLSEINKEIESIQYQDILYYFSGLTKVGDFTVLGEYLGE